MIFDMHCHTSEGSLDALIGVRKTIEILKEKGYNGVVITDHNSYKGYEKAMQIGKIDDFIIIRGIEYDTCDAGHVLIILPDGVDLPILTRSGLSARNVIDLVHSANGVVGLAHPFGHGRFGIWWYITHRHLEDIFPLFDFIEVFNSTATPLANNLAKMTADKYGLTPTSGSDSHRHSTVGLAKTVFKRKINNSMDLIEAIRENSVLDTSGEYSTSVQRKVLRVCYLFCAFLYHHYRQWGYRRNWELLSSEFIKFKRKLVNSTIIDIEEISINGLYYSEGGILEE